MNVKINKDILDDLLALTDHKFTKKTIEDITSNKPSLAILLMRRSENLTGNIDDIVLQMVYGNSRKYPGDEKSPCRALMKRDEENEDNTVLGIWAPPNKLAKATALKLLFPNLSGPYRFPDFVPTPLYVAVGYDAFKARDILKLSDQYPGQVMAYGFFTSDVPQEGQLISKTVEEFEARTTLVTFNYRGLETLKKIVIQLIKENPECLAAFMDLGPSYVSSDAVVGEEECKSFFPPDYNAPAVEVTEVKKKSRRKGKKHSHAVNKDDVASIATSDPNIDVHSEADHLEDENEEESDEEKPEGFTDREGNGSGADKATSPIHHENMQ
ncbi:hypothetical protein NQ317_007727 [Molorchus minor]|uniref:DUF4746 domain-containing protein n=1 Tax=Molorchus minor TaxID=1323400 RepID=A0ABQ9JVQ3_9CUCU|nr:hypothetical protein NQ317_007727 [Molorchus minor]